MSTSNAVPLCRIHDARQDECTVVLDLTSSDLDHRVSDISPIHRHKRSSALS
jgi:hypothetical protein